ncbi:MAG: hypothetical protein DRJ15_10105 [Bacteroidetes bacterium]|nr:MAG: hypothetical protein DRJ15_10105 [Bacteroidota bacterium]
MNDIQDPELPIYDSLNGWYAVTRKGLLTRMFRDNEEQMDPDLYKEAVMVAEECIRTGEPPFGGWR